MNKGRPCELVISLDRDSFGNLWHSLYEAIGVLQSALAVLDAYALLCFEFSFYDVISADDSAWSSLRDLVWDRHRSRCGDWGLVFW